MTRAGALSPDFLNYRRLFCTISREYTGPACEIVNPAKGSEVQHLMNWKSKLILGVLTALAMMFLTYTLPRGGGLRDAALVQFPVTVGVWAIFVLLFVKLK